ncbi:MAG: hypothetical protein OXU45_04995 [Candidatus Melainabacteria bacterium]|nr:hypothetical protein [Candidatus Melainabacteria bacterium]
MSDLTISALFFFGGTTFTVLAMFFFAQWYESRGAKNEEKTSH